MKFEILCAALTHWTFTDPQRPNYESRCSHHIRPLPNRKGSPSAHSSLSETIFTPSGPQSNGIQLPASQRIIQTYTDKPIMWIWGNHRCPHSLATTKPASHSVNLLSLLWFAHPMWLCKVCSALFLRTASMCDKETAPVSYAQCQVSCIQPFHTS